MANSKRVPRWRWPSWFTEGDTKEENRLVMKLDLLIVPYAFLSYWVKYLDQANLNNAYVSGLKQDLGFSGNELVHLQTIYVVGAVLGQIPFMFLFTKVPMYWLIPFLDVMWGVFTLLQYCVTSYGELLAYRFMVGWFEAAYFPAIHFIFGTFYRRTEIARRGGVFYIGLTLGTLTAGFIQAAASATLDGKDGLAGWRWMYIICAIITIPIGILGFFVLPGTPEMPNKLVLSEHDVKVIRIRLEKDGHVTQGKFQWRTIIDVAKSRKFLMFLLLDVFFWNGSTNTTTGGYLLWLKSLKRYSTPKVNELGTISPALGIVYTLFICFMSDFFLGPAWAITWAHTWNAIGLIILVIWDVPESAKWFAFATTYSAVAMSSVLYGWVNSSLKDSPAQRSFVLVVINTVSQSTTAWTPLLVYPTVEAPRFKKGYPFTLTCSICLMITAHVIYYMFDRNRDILNDQESEQGPEVEHATSENVPKTFAE